MVNKKYYDPKPEDSTTDNRDSGFWDNLVDDCPIIASDDY